LSQEKNYLFCFFGGELSFVAIIAEKLLFGKKKNGNTEYLTKIRKYDIITGTLTIF
jgi:hypothetical protein